MSKNTKTERIVVPTNPQPGIGTSPWYIYAKDLGDYARSIGITRKDPRFHLCFFKMANAGVLHPDLVKDSYVHRVDERGCVEVASVPGKQYKRLIPVRDGFTPYQLWYLWKAGQLTPGESDNYPQSREKILKGCDTTLLSFGNFTKDYPNWLDYLTSNWLGLAVGTDEAWDYMGYTPHPVPTL